MRESTSNLEHLRVAHGEEPGERREHLLASAEKVFLDRGIARTTMQHIADGAGVSRVTVYRYFAERDDIAYAVAGRMLGVLAKVGRDAIEPGTPTMPALRAALQAQFSEFDRTRDAHRYLAMFDSLAPMNPSSDDWGRWYEARCVEAFWLDSEEWLRVRLGEETLTNLVALVGVTMGTLGRLALHHHALRPEQVAQIEPHLAVAEAAVLRHFDEVMG